MTRDNSVDIAKGIAIIAVIVGHCHYVTGIYHQIIYSFHMPLFFIFAGWFYKEKGIKVSLEKDFFRLIVPYLFLGAICVTKYLITKSIKGDYYFVVNQLIGILWATTKRSSNLILGGIPSAGIIWFLPAMFWCKNIWNIICIKTNKKKKRIIFGTSVAVLAMLLDRYVINIPFGILPGAGAVIFYMIGYYLRQLKVPCWALPIGIIFWVVSILYSEVILGNNHYGLYPIDVIGTTSASWVIYHISRRLSKFQLSPARYLSWMGKNSMVIYGMHYIVIIIDPNTRLAVHNWFTWLVIDFMLIIPFSIVCTKIPLTKRIFQIK